MNENFSQGEKPFRCQDCGMEFSQKAQLVRHRNIHNDRGDFVCGVCAATFTRTSNLIQHVHAGRCRKIDKSEQIVK